MKHSEFYSVMAQVMPVLVLAIVFEMRALDRAATMRGRLYAALLIYILGIAEALAIAGIYTARDPEAARIWIVFSTIFAGGYLLENIIGPPLNELRRSTTRWAGVAVALGLSVVSALPLYVVLKVFHF